MNSLGYAKKAVSGTKIGSLKFLDKLLMRYYIAVKYSDFDLFVYCFSRYFRHCTEIFTIDKKL